MVRRRKELLNGFCHHKTKKASKKRPPRGGDFFRPTGGEIAFFVFGF